MATRISKCPKCGSDKVNVLKEELLRLSGSNKMTEEVIVYCEKNHKWKEHRKTDAGKRNNSGILW